ncbi:MAG: glutamate racemase [Mariprofundus sp.]
MQADQAIGVFDSGVGGLTVLAHIHRCLPNEKLLYVADSAFMPYGCKPEHAVEQRCLKIAAFFAAQQCKAVVVACNTATAVAVHLLREKYDFPVIGMEPAVKPAVCHSQSGVVGILATSATAASEKFRQLTQRFDAEVELVVQACPGLVEQIEQGESDNETTRILLQSFLHPLIEKGIDTLVLGCTHYPFLRALIRDIAGEHISIIDSGNAIACELERQLKHHQLLAENSAAASVEFWSSGHIQCVEPLLSHLWQERVLLKKLPF